MRLMWYYPIHLHFPPLAELLASVERSFGDPYWERMACAQLHALKMMMAMTSNDYMANFGMLAGRTSFNEVALEDMLI